MPINLDPSPQNELGKGILDPELEQRLLADGYIYARRVFHGKGYFLNLAKSPIRAIATKIFADLLAFQMKHPAPGQGEEQK